MTKIFNWFCKNQKKILIVLSVLMLSLLTLAMVFLINSLNYSILIYSSLFIFTIICLLFEYKISITICLFYLSVEILSVELFNSIVDIKIACILILSIVTFVKETIQVFKQKKFFTSSFFIILIFCLIAFMNFNISGILYLIFYATALSNIYFIYKYRKKINLKNACLNIIYGIIYFIAIYFILNIIFKGNYVSLLKYDRFSGVCLNPNTLQILVSTSLSFLIYLYFSKKIKYKTFLILSFVLCFLGFATGSKSFVLLILFLIISYFVYSFKQNKYNACIELSTLLLIIALMYTIFGEMFNELLDRFINSFGENLLDKILTGRLAIWNKYIVEIFSDFKHALFGFGLTAEPLNTVGPHSELINLVFRIGILGTLILLFSFVYIMIRLIVNQKIKYYVLLPLITVIFIGIIEVIFTPSISMIIGISIILLNDLPLKQSLKVNHLKKPTVAFVMPLFSLPVDGSSGGAIETLLANLIKKNEKEEKFFFYVLTPTSKKIEYKFTQVVNIKTIGLLDKINVFLDTILLKLKFIKRKRYNSFYFNTVEDILDTFKPDNVIFESKYPFNVSNITQSIGRNNMFLHIHNYEYGKEDISRYFGNLISVSEFIKNDMDNHIKYSKSINSTVLHNFITSENFYKKCNYEEIKNLRLKYGYKDDDFVILYVGRLNKDKGIHVLIDAFSKVKKENLYLLIVGNSFFKNSKPNRYTQLLIEKSASKIDKIKFTGFISNSELFRYYQMCDLQVIPTLCEEAAGLVALEGNISQIDQIITNSGGLKEYANPNAIVIERDDNLIDNLYDKIMYSYSIKNKTKRKKFINKNIYDLNFAFKEFIDIIENKHGENNK